MQSFVDFAKAEPGIFHTMFGLTEDHADDPDLIRADDDTSAITEQVVAEHPGLPFNHPQAKLRASALWRFVHGKLSVPGFKVARRDVESTRSAASQKCSSAVLVVFQRAFTKFSYSGISF